MKQNPSTHKPYSLSTPVDAMREFISTCPRCGGEVDLWSGAEETFCIFCNQKIFARETTTH